MDVVRQHNGGIQTLHIGIDHRPDHARDKDIRIPTRHLAARSPARQGMLVPQVFPHEQRFDLGRRAGTCHLAIGHGEHLGEVERRARQVPRQTSGFQHVIPGIGDEPLRLLLPHARDVPAFNVGPLR